MRKVKLNVIIALVVLAIIAYIVVPICIKLFGSDDNNNNSNNNNNNSNTNSNS